MLTNDKSHWKYGKSTISGKSGRPCLETKMQPIAILILKCYIEMRQFVIYISNQLILLYLKYISI
jgi:hypothetical protein